MSEHRATIEWRRETAAFDYQTYNRSHILSFEGGIQVPAAAAPGNIPASAVRGSAVDPEQAFVAALASCHMLWFLHLACEAGYNVERYTDEAVGVMGKNADKRIAITKVTLRPRVRFTGTAPDPSQHAGLHERAHEKCYIANSVNCELALEPSID
jgi:organic hydroperoxide reductase OsmC/OhrA